MGQFVEIEDWQETWKKNFIPWHLNDVNPFLIKFCDYLTQSRKGQKIFVPLCGKTLDMKWLLEQGHSVVGIDASEKAIHEFMQENKYEYTTEPCSIGQVMKTKDGKCILYAGDLYKLTRDTLGPCDAIWDRGSFVAIKPEDRPKYVKLLKTFLAPDGRHIIESYFSTNKDHQGPPHFLSDQMIKDLVGNSSDVKVIYAETNKTSEDVVNYMSFYAKFPPTEHVVTIFITCLSAKI